MLDSYFAADRQRRSRLEIKIIVMQAIAEGRQRQSHIMYYAKLPSRMCARIVRTMEQQGLIEAAVKQEGGRKVKRFALTERGKRSLDSYLVIMNALKPTIENTISVAMKDAMPASSTAQVAVATSVIPANSDVKRNLN
jgi:predicted transcriptional regulator